MNIKNIIGIFFVALILQGCATKYTKKGSNGGYTDRPLSRYSHFIRYDSGFMDSLLGSLEGLQPLWMQRAKDLCKGDEFYHQINAKRVGKQLGAFYRGHPVLYGVAYCNAEFVDTRQHANEDQFIPYKELPYSVFSYDEISPLWSLFVAKEYGKLEDEVGRMYDSYLNGELSEVEIAGFLNTFSRLNSVSEEGLSEWVSAFPQSFLALYSRAVFYSTKSWGERGTALWVDVTAKQKKGFLRYGELAKFDIERAMNIEADFSLLHSLKITVYTGNKSDDFLVSEMFDNARKISPESIGIHAAYFRHLLPRWYGSKGEMRSFIGSSVNRHESLRVLEALYLAEEGDQFLFKKKYKMALGKYNEAIKIGQFANIYNRRGQVFSELGRYVDAIDSYAIAVAMSPYYDSAYEGLANTLLKQGDYLGALKASMYLTTVNSENSGYFEFQGDLFYGMRRYDDALVSYKNALALSSKKAKYKHKIKLTEYQIEVRKEGESLEGLERII